VFSFFRKEKPDDFLAFLKEGQDAFGPGPTYSGAKQPVEDASAGIEVQETIGGLVPELEEAAVLYANGKIGETATLLNRYLLDHRDNHDPLPWYMLFDLYEVSDQSAPFEDAAVDFAVKFERSPPTWTPRDKPKSNVQPAPLMTYGEKYGSLERVKQSRFFHDAEQAPYVRLDLSKTLAPDEETARAILNDILRLHEMKKPVELIGGPGFAVRLDAARQGGRLTETGWFLFLAVLQLLGKEEDFDNAAVDYAIAYEVSPPSYTPPRPLPKENGTSDILASPTPDTSFKLTGLIGPGCEGQFRDLKQYAQGRKQVEIDLSQVSRIDFSVVGLLLETLIGISGAGSKILFKEGNELVNTLLHIVGASQFAVVLGRTRA
jgi:ABC-type transporter Mla MlaB component